MKVISNTAEINVDLIPDDVFGEFATAVLDMAEKVMSTPDANRRYQEWLKGEGAKYATCAI